MNQYFVFAFACDEAIYEISYGRNEKPDHIGVHRLRVVVRAPNNDAGAPRRRPTLLLMFQIRRATTHQDQLFHRRRGVHINDVCTKHVSYTHKHKHRHTDIAKVTLLNKIYTLLEDLHS